MKVRGFWCDGVAMPFVDGHVDNDFVQRAKQITTSAWLGKNGQDKYELVIKFGKQALDLYACGGDLSGSLADEMLSGVIHVDATRKTIEIQLR